MTEKDACILPVSAFVIDKTMRNTAKKYEFTYKSLMYERTPIELLDNIYMGDMAKNALFDYLKKHCEKPVIDYDEIRTDNFTEHDPGWDIMVGYNKIKVEVKSSIPPHGESMSSIVANRDIKITASHDNGKTWIQPKDLESNIHVQIYFYAHPWKIGPYNSFEELYNDISNDYTKIDTIIGAKKYNQPWFCGWNTKKNIIKYASTLSPNTWTFSWTKRIYWRCPIKDSFNLQQLIEVVEKY